MLEAINLALLGFHMLMGVIGLAQKSAEAPTPTPAVVEQAPVQDTRGATE